EGLPALPSAARDVYRRGRDSSPGGLERMVPPPLFPLDQTDFESALAAGHLNIEQTARGLDRDEVNAAIDAIAKAKLIVVCGTDQMAFFASYMRNLLMLLDFRVELVAAASQEGLARLARLDDKSLLVGFSAG